MPTLWEGTVVAASGVPAAGAKVHAFVRPPASIIPTRDRVESAGKGDRPLESIPLGSVDVGPDGTFVLAADLPQNVPRDYWRDGWLQVMLFVEGADGEWAVATDAVRHVAATNGRTRPAWISSPSSRERADAKERARTLDDEALAREVAADGSQDGERPAVIRLQPAPRPASDGKALADYVPPGPPYVGCIARYVAGYSYGDRIIAELDMGPAWTGRIEYQRTHSTSWEVGYSASGSNWQIGGSTSFDNSSSNGFITEVSSGGGIFQESYKVNLKHARVHWQCATQSNPGPYYVDTVEAVQWTGGTANGGDPDIGCNTNYKRTVAGNTYSWREAGSRSTYSASGNVWGFNGKATVGYTSTIRLGWRNNRGDTRYVCGERGEPFRSNTRVEALP